MGNCISCPKPYRTDGADNYTDFIDVDPKEELQPIGYSSCIAGVCIIVGFRTLPSVLYSIRHLDPLYDPNTINHSKH